MRKTAIVLSILGLAALSAVPALATPLLTELFPYVNGNLAISPAVSLGNWANHSGAGTDVQVVSGTAQGNMTNSPDDNRTFAPQSATAKTYACFLVTIPEPTAAPLTAYFAHFKDTGTSNFVARLYVTPSGTSFTFAISVSSATAMSYLALWGSPLSYNTQYNVVIDYDAALGTSDLWVNPVNESSTKVTSSTTSAPTPIGTLVSAFALRQSSSGILPGATFKYIVDDIGVGTNFTDACTASTIAVEPRTWSNVKSFYR